MCLRGGHQTDGADGLLLRGNSKSLQSIQALFVLKLDKLVGCLR